jgi:hypothetical protein
MTNEVSPPINYDRLSNCREYVFNAMVSAVMEQRPNTAEEECQERILVAWSRLMDLAAMGRVMSLNDNERDYVEQRILIAHLARVLMDHPYIPEAHADSGIR